MKNKQTNKQTNNPKQKTRTDKDTARTRGDQIQSGYRLTNQQPRALLQSTAAGTETER